MWVFSYSNSGLEYAYWNGLHSVPYSSMGWNVAKFLVDWVFSPVIRGAFSTMSCFNHRVSDIRANVKFQDEGNGDGSPKRRGRGKIMRWQWHWCGVLALADTQGASIPTSEGIDAGFMRAQV